MLCMYCMYTLCVLSTERKGKKLNQGHVLSFFGKEEEIVSLNWVQQHYSEIPLFKAMHILIYFFKEVTD